MSVISAEKISKRLREGWENAEKITPCPSNFCPDKNLSKFWNFCHNFCNIFSNKFFRSDYSRINYLHECTWMYMNCTFVNMLTFMLFYVQIISNSSSLLFCLKLVIFDQKCRFSVNPYLKIPENWSRNFSLISVFLVMSGIVLLENSSNIKNFNFRFMSWSPAAGPISGKLIQI